MSTATPSLPITPSADASLEGLFQPLQLGAIALSNRVIMAPLTRARAGVSRIPNDLMRQYYVQRASAGLIISEATQISQQGTGWVQTPGIYTPAQVEGWKAITDAVHQKGGKIVLQLWHMGRASHPDFQPDGALPVSASAIRPAGEIHTPQGKKPHVTPRALTLDEIPGVIDQYVAATRNAKLAGFDGVEVHGANGYLIDQFLRDGSNQRTDAYGGNVENRTRFLLEVTEAVIQEWSSDSPQERPGQRVGVRLSPYNPFNDMRDSDPIATFTYAARALRQFNLAYLHIVEPLSGHFFSVDGVERAAPHMQREFGGPVILNGGYSAASGATAIHQNEAEAIAYGVPFIANPDLVERFKRGESLNEANPETFYTHGPEGYIDYPLLAA